MHNKTPKDIPIEEYYKRMQRISMKRKRKAINMLKSFDSLKENLNVCDLPNYYKNVLWRKELNYE